MSYCITILQQGGGLYLSLFLAGLFGGFTHCVGMCGPFVLGQVGARLEHIPLEAMTSWRRLSGMALMPYHLGRLTTYVAMGGVGAMLASPFTGASWFRYFAAGLLLMAALVFLASAFPASKARLSAKLPSAGLISRLANPLFKKPIGLNGYFLGILLGFLPCGLVYAALAAALSTGEALTAMVGMGAFALGTMPALVITAAGGSYLMRQSRMKLVMLSRMVMVLNGLILLSLAVSLLSK